jgi:hypothetical protein
MITLNVTGMSTLSLHVYKGLQYYNKMPDKKSKVCNSFCALLPLPPHHAGTAAAATATRSFDWQQEKEGGLSAPLVATLTKTRCLLHDCHGRGRLNLNRTCRGQGWGTTFFPHHAAHCPVRPRRQNSDSNDGGGRRQHERDNGRSRH